LASTELMIPPKFLRRLATIPEAGIVPDSVFVGEAFKHEPSPWRERNTSLDPVILAGYGTGPMILVMVAQW